VSVLDYTLLDSPPSPSPSTGSPAPSIGRDLKIDTVTRELVLTNGDLVLTRDADAIKQAIDMHLRTFRGEWFLDESVGVPYLETVLVKSPDLDVIKSTLRREILAVPGVDSVTLITLNYDRAARKLSANWSVRADVGVINGTTSLQR
jgi:hypothetical protein